MDVRTDIWDPLMLLGQLGEVDLKIIIWVMSIDSPVQMSSVTRFTTECANKLNWMQHRSSSVAYRTTFKVNAKYLK